MQAEALRARLEREGLLVRWPAGAPAVVPAVTTDSRHVERDALFLAYRGSVVDGHDYLAAAARAGAAFALVERPVPGVAIPQAEVRDGKRAASVAASAFFGNPGEALVLLAVTGTNGKTTTAHLLRHLFGDRAPAGSIGTLGAIDGKGDLVPTGGSLTTPGPVELFRALALLRHSGVQTVAMEASSHSLDQDRIAGLEFQAAVFTNLTRDHLDYHGDEAHYLAAKVKLDRYLAPGGFQVVNADDRAWAALPRRSEHITFGVKDPADVRAEDVAGDRLGMRFNLVVRGASAPVALPLLGTFNVENALGAAAAAIALGREPAWVAKRLGAAPQVPGRMERLTEKPCVVLRDYAHTPDALERALAALRPLTKGRLVVVFGAGGDRDTGKRPLMGAIAAKGADLSVVTSDNPRTEDPEKIMHDIEAGMGGTPHLRIVDRRAAVQRALAIAKPDDVILLAGKGHETYQVVGEEHVPMDEREIVAAAVGGAGAGAGTAGEGGAA
ncbi:MAG TPA: UDP-N-acetylmuramoyl-L-alanyl-D-glutamate--2,6-diaminopimelate ligase [Gemmatimonadales bacterium]|nr:UDP-N-acetylmuramoyl-L-alanyl-D-glutamate--2,6-diaminopimelate ligase [Gemmatimonadales bacterium]